MNVGVSSPYYQPISSSQLPEEKLPSKPSIDNAGSVLKPVSSLPENSAKEARLNSQQNLEPAAELQNNDSIKSDAQDSRVPKENQERLREQRLESQQQKLEQQQILQLAARDREVRNHERAHTAVGGQYAGAPRYQFERGPDGVNYAVSGEVSISAGSINGDPQATIEKAQVVRRAALAPSEPSSQDRKVAAQATQMEVRARVELANMQREQRLAEQEGRSQQQEGEVAPTESPNNDAQLIAQSKADTEDSPPFFSPEEQAEQQKDFYQQMNMLNRRIVSADVNSLHIEPGQLLNHIV